MIGGEESNKHGELLTTYNTQNNQTKTHHL